MTQHVQTKKGPVAWADGRLTVVPEGLLPGRVCAHTHLYSGLAPFGMPAPDPAPESFVQILERVWWRLDRALNAEALRAGARLYIAEALLAGTTTLIDHHESPNLIEGSLDVLAEAAEELGVRMALCYGATERNGGLQELEAGLRECERFGRSSGRLRGFVGLHASFTVSDEGVRRAAALCERTGMAMHVHVAEDRADVTDAVARGYGGPLERLQALGALPKGSLIAHGLFLSEAQVAQAEAEGWWFLHSPRSNEGNGVGYASSLVGSRRVALGTDGYPADMRVELAEGRRLAVAHGQEAHTMDQRLAAGVSMVGELYGTPVDATVGAAADFIEEREGAVQTVVVDGRVVVSEGQLRTADIEELRASAARAAEGLWERMRELT